jgi:hypothetical protein
MFGILMRWSKWRPPKRMKNLLHIYKNVVWNWTTTLIKRKSTYKNFLSFNFLLAFFFKRPSQDLCEISFSWTLKKPLCEDETKYNHYPLNPMDKHFAFHFRSSFKTFLFTLFFFSSLTMNSPLYLNIILSSTYFYGAHDTWNGHKKRIIEILISYFICSKEREVLWLRRSRQQKTVPF